MIERRGERERRGDREERCVRDLTVDPDKYNRRIVMYHGIKMYYCYTYSLLYVVWARISELFIDLKSNLIQHKTIEIIYALYIHIFIYNIIQLNTSTSYVL